MRSALRQVADRPAVYPSRQPSWPCAVAAAIAGRNTNAGGPRDGTSCRHMASHGGGNNVSFTCKNATLQKNCCNSITDRLITLKSTPDIIITKIDNPLYEERYHHNHASFFAQVSCGIIIGIIGCWNNDAAGMSK